MPVQSLKHRISARELVQWAAFEERFGPITFHERVDYAAALISYVVAGALSGNKKLNVSDFAPRWGTRKRQDLFTFLERSSKSLP